MHVFLTLARCVKVTRRAKNALIAHVVSGEDGTLGKAVIGTVSVSAETTPVQQQTAEQQANQKICTIGQINPQSQVT